MTLRLHAVVESYPPMLRAGSEMAAHTLFRYLQDQGWKVSVHVTRWPTADLTLDGIKVIPKREVDCDLVYTHLWEAWPQAQQAARHANAPICYWVHANSPMPPPADYLIANTEYLADKWDCQGVLHPPVVQSDYQRSGTLAAAAAGRPRGRCITRIGLSEAKGGKVFFELAKRMPNHRFLGVVGAWGPQYIELPKPNTQVWGNTDDMQAVYAQTRILIMPSDGHETYGRVAIEAMACGIPVICSPLPGLWESVEEAGIYANRHDLDCYQAMIECLDSPKEYRYHRDLCLKRAAAVEARMQKQLPALEAELRKLTTKRKVLA